MAAPVITPINDNVPVIVDFRNWLNVRPNYSLAAPELHGGWERWASADIGITLKLNAAARSIVDVQTESYCYNDANLPLNQRARMDFIVCRDRPAPRWDLVELKCWRVKSAAKQGLVQFLTEFATDVTKIQRVLKPGEFERPTRLWAVGVAIKHWMNAAEVQALVQAQNNNGYVIYDTGDFFLITTFRDAVLVPGQGYYA